MTVWDHRHCADTVYTLGISGPYPFVPLYCGSQPGSPFGCWTLIPRLTQLGRNLHVCPGIIHVSSPSLRCLHRHRIFDHLSVYPPLYPPTPKEWPTTAGEGTFYPPSFHDCPTHCPPRLLSLKTAASSFQSIPVCHPSLTRDPSSCPKSTKVPSFTLAEIGWDEFWCEPIAFPTLASTQPLPPAIVAVPLKPASTCLPFRSTIRSLDHSFPSTAPSTIYLPDTARSVTSARVDSRSFRPRPVELTQKASVCLG